MDMFIGGYVYRVIVDCFPRHFEGYYTGANWLQYIKSNCEYF